jgi:EF hand
MRRSSCILPIMLFLAQGQSQPPQDAVRPRFLSPILDVLDANRDGIIDADEIANAAQALLKLDKNGDGRLTPDEYRPPRPDGQLQPAPLPGKAGMKPVTLERPRPPLDAVLDENGDEVIDAQEIARAPILLKKLDLNGDGRLTPDEYMPKPPMRDNKK